MASIRFFLVAGILAILTLFNFVAALRGYQSSMAEAELLFDNELLDLSRLVANLDFAQLPPDFRLGNNMAFQVWQDKELLAASFHAPPDPITALRPGFDYANFDGFRWRTYSRYQENGDIWVIVAERTDLRFILAENVVLESITPILIGIPLIGLLIWFVVSQGLRPLQLLSTELRNKHINDLTPINYVHSKKELHQVIQSLNGLFQRLDRALEREKRFSADAAHELRTPISALKIQLHNLQHEIGGDSESFLALQAGVDRMQHLIEQLLSLYRMTPDQFSENCEVIDLAALTRDMVARHYSLFENKQQKIELKQLGGEALIIGEKFALETLITNLLSNASKYTPPKGRIRITSRLDPKSNRVCLTVEDNGPGISESERDRVFERFYRASKEDNLQIPGCGLGLTIVKHVVDLHQAKLSLEESDFSSGAKFTVCFDRYQYPSGNQSENA